MKEPEQAKFLKSSEENTKLKFRSRNYAATWRLSWRRPQSNGGARLGYAPRDASDCRDLPTDTVLTLRQPMRCWSAHDTQRHLTTPVIKVFW
ncbi:hypothetical protein WA026_016343 [Henosepilachna vigintioctopunctata]|uniref:Uncharacterized protein n=1 Tax=Henosepilachna vigintioctopunctata TaxID=420089 RepID=A0AAW1UCR0_9CUCU